MSNKLTKTNPSQAILSKLEAVDKMTKTELQTVVKEFMLPLTEPAKYKEIVKSSMPELVQQLDNKEDLTTAMAETGQEMMLAVAETLRKYHNFSDSELTLFLKNLRDNLHIVQEIEAGGLSMLSDHSMRHIVDMVDEVGINNLLQKIAEIRYQKEHTWRNGLEHPNYLEGSKLERKLQKPRK